MRTNMNRLFSCGNGNTYALGHGNKDTCKSFWLIKFFNNDHIFPGEEIVSINDVIITSIACGLMHSGCILDNGNVY